MIWSPVAVAAVFSLVATAVAIVLIHNWARVEPLLSRWVWLVLAVWFGYSAFGSLRTGQTTLGLAEAGLAILLFWSFASRLRRRRARRPSSKE